MVETTVDDDILGLYFDVEKGKGVDLEVAAAAAIEWAQAMRAAMAAIDPQADFRIEMIGQRDGSLWVFAKIGKVLARALDGWDKLPRAQRIAIAFAIFVATTGYPTYDFYFGDHGFSDRQKEELREIIQQAKSAPGFEDHKQKMFKIAERDSSIKALGVAAGFKSKPDISVPRDQFPEFGGLWAVQVHEQSPTQRILTPELDVILVAAQFENAPRAWTFRQEGLPSFRAIMKDKAFLNALESADVQERFRMRIPMRIRLEIKEVLQNGEWKLARKGRSVVKVISPEVR